MISIAMLLRIRWDLIAADTNEAFTLLLRYPEPGAPAYTFIKDALYLRDHLTLEGGAEIITRYGNKAPDITAIPPPDIRLPSPSPSTSSHRTRNSIGSPRAFVSQQGAGIEALLQGAAKNVLEKGSQWGVGKAIRDAVGEVRRHAEAIQVGVPSTPVSGQSTPRSGGREYRKPAQLSAANSRPGMTRTQSANILKKVESLETRNKNLAKMLESAVAELWDYHKERSEEGAESNQTKGDSIEALSLAIAKVQFVQVYLEDSSIPLPVDETTEQAVSSLLSCWYWQVKEQMSTDRLRPQSMQQPVSSRQHHHLQAQSPNGQPVHPRYRTMHEPHPSLEYETPPPRQTYSRPPR